MHLVHSSALSAIDLNLLVVLRALLTERHVTRAAKRVGLSQSATSHALSRLRELYDDPLLVRSGRVLELTPRARTLLPALERGLSDLKATLDGEAEFAPQRARRAFTLGMADYAQAVMLGPLLRELERQAPGVDLTALTFPNLTELALAGNIDLALDVSGRAPSALLQSQRLFDDGFVCMVRKAHPQVQKRLSMERYLSLRHVVVAPTGASGSIVDTELEKRGLERRIALRVSNFLAAPLVVSQSDFVSTMPRRLAVQVARHYSLRILPPPLPLPTFGFSLVWHPRFERDAAHAWLRALIVSVSEKLLSR